MKKFILFVLLSSSFASAHGMSELGPHKGYIQMPGSFHTEVVQNTDGSFKIYLIDIEFKNPMTKNSGVKAKLKSKRTTELKCSAVNDYFNCTGLAKLVNKGELTILATRDGIKGNEAIYQLPMKLQK